MQPAMGTALLVPFRRNKDEGCVPTTAATVPIGVSCDSDVYSGRTKRPICS